MEHLTFVRYSLLQSNRLIDSLVVSSEGCPGCNPQTRTASYQRRYKMEPVFLLFSTDH